MATLEIDTSVVLVDSIETLSLNLTDNNGGFFFDRTNDIPSFSNQELEIRVLAQSVPEPSSAALLILSLTAYAMRRRKT